jgi:hypothetical protein
MHLTIAAALALAAQASPANPGAPVASNLEYSMPVEGGWSYSTTAGGSEAVFSNASGAPQMTLRCTRSNRHIALIKTAASASPTMWVWTSSQQKNLPVTYDPTAGTVTAELGAYDALLDAIASSRGRIGFSTSGVAALVVPPWAEVGRVIEDCRV